MWEGLCISYYRSEHVFSQKEIVDPESSIASTGTLLMVTNIVESVCRTVATVISSVWPSNWNAWWPAQALL